MQTGNVKRDTQQRSLAEKRLYSMCHNHSATRTAHIYLNNIDQNRRTHTMQFRTKGSPLAKNAEADRRIKSSQINFIYTSQNYKSQFASRGFRICTTYDALELDEEKLHPKKPLNGGKKPQDSRTFSIGSFLPPWLFILLIVGPPYMRVLYTPL